MKKTITMTYKAGQTLVILLVFITIAVSVTVASATIIVTNLQNSTKVQQGTDALRIAESGVENALLRLVRDPTYTGETMTVGSSGGTATIVVVTNGSTKTITSTGKVGSYIRKIQVNTGVSNGLLLVTPPWTEVQ